MHPIWVISTNPWIRIIGDGKRKRLTRASAVLKAEPEPSSARTP